MYQKCQKSNLSPKHNLQHYLLIGSGCWICPEFHHKDVKLLLFERTLNTCFEINNYAKKKISTY